MKLINDAVTRWLAPERTILQSLFLLIVRLYWGWQFFQTGKGKLMDLDKPTQFFQSLGIPFPHLQAMVCGITECLGGLLILVGLLSRLISIPLTILLTVAYLTADIDRAKAIFGDPDKFVTADEFLFLYTVLVVLLFGPGKLSLDWLMTHKSRGSQPA